MEQTSSTLTYVLVTAAFNEEFHIGSTILSVLAQTHLPLRWIIVSDGSTDRTDEIVQQYAQQNNFIQLLRIGTRHAHNFGAQVHAINAGVKEMENLTYDFIGNLDADILLEPYHFQWLLKEFEKDMNLGLAGGFVCDLVKGGGFRNRKMNSTRSVPHAIQLFRRECFRSAAAYVPLPYGGPDTHAEVSARSRGWVVKCFPELKVRHLRPTGTADGRLKSYFRQGLMDHSLGYHPAYEIVKNVRRIWARPFPLAALAKVVGFSCGYLTGTERPVSREFINFIRREQMDTLSQWFRHFIDPARKIIWERHRHQNS